MTTVKMASLARVSLRQLQWWDECNVVSPLQECHRRTYSEAAAVQVMIVAELRRKGLSLQRIRRVLKLANNLPLPSLLLTDGFSVVGADDAKSIVSVLVRAQRGMYLVDIAKIQDKLRSSS